MPVISWRELVEEKDKVMLIDTRTPEEFSFGTIPGAVNIPLDEMREHLAEIPTDKPVVLFCAVGLRGYLSLRILMGCGYRNVRNLIGVIRPTPRQQHLCRLYLLRQRRLFFFFGRGCY